MLRKTVFAVIIFLLFVQSAFAGDVSGSRDHPLFRRPSGYAVIAYSAKDGGMAVPGENGNLFLSGRMTDIYYRAERQPLSSSALTQRFLLALRKAGGEVLFQENPALGGARAVGRLIRPGRDVWVTQDVLSLREYRLTVLETPNNRTNLLPIPVSCDLFETEAQVLDLLHRLDKIGYLDFSVGFASGSSDLPKEVQLDLEKIVLLMGKDSSLSFSVSAYADSGMRPADERRLSLNRRTAFLEALVRLNADASRLTAEPSGEGKDGGNDAPHGVVRLTSVGPIRSAAR